MPTVYKEVEVEIGLEDYSDVELIEELGRRESGFKMQVETPAELITKIYELRRNGRDYQSELDQLIYTTIGRVI